MCRDSAGRDLLLHSSIAAGELHRADSWCDGALQVEGPMFDVKIRSWTQVMIFNTYIHTHIYISNLGWTLKLPSRATASVWHRASPFRRLKMILGGVGIS